MPKKTAIIIGAGPAGLTAAYELLTRTDVKPIVVEDSAMMGGLSRTVNYKGNRIDIGGHRFFSKSERVMKWWSDMLPIEWQDDDAFAISYHGKRHTVRNGNVRVDPCVTDDLMLVRSRKSRIFFMRTFFDYPIRLSVKTLRNMGLVRMVRIVSSYLMARLFPIRNEQNLEQFFINRFGRELYQTFFKSYTEKVWGVPCSAISAEWGAQRIKGLSIGKAVAHAVKRLFKRDDSIVQDGTETSLIEKFLYPKYGPGQMWETCAEKLIALGGQIITNTCVRQIHLDGDRISAVVAKDRVSGKDVTFHADYVFSTMPIKELIRAFVSGVPDQVREVSEGLVYRDFITVGLLCEELKIKDEAPDGNKLLKDNWIYIQEPDVQVGRLQLFNNWSPYMVADRTKVWLGMEYFCNATDVLWRLSDEELVDFGTGELAKLGFIEKSTVVDATVIRMPKTYPAYLGTYNRFDEIRQFVDRFANLYLIGRNGMHRYNNQDHSMLTAMTAVDNILAGRNEKGNIWDVNTEQEYHEEEGARGATSPHTTIADSKPSAEVCPLPSRSREEIELSV